MRALRHSLTLIAALSIACAVALPAYSAAPSPERGAPATKQQGKQQHGGDRTDAGVPKISIADGLAGGMANGFEAASGTPQGSWFQILAAWGPQAVKAAATPAQWSAINAFAKRQVDLANANYAAGMAQGVFSQSTLAWQRDNILSTFRGWTS